MFTSALRSDIVELLPRAELLHWPVVIYIHVCPQPYRRLYVGILAKNINWHINPENCGKDCVLWCQNDVDLWPWNSIHFISNEHLVQWKSLQIFLRHWEWGRWTNTSGGVKTTNSRQERAQNNKLNKNVNAVWMIGAWIYIAYCIYLCECIERKTNIYGGVNAQYVHGWDICSLYWAAGSSYKITAQVYV